MLNLYFIRHAESEMNANPGLIGGRCPWAQLTKKGIQQATLLGKYLKENNIYFKEVHSSPIARAQDTAKLVCIEQKFPLEKIILWDDLQELSQGQYEGKPRKDCFTREVIEQMKTQHEFYRSPGGESQREVSQRMYQFVQDRFLWRYGRAVISNVTAGIFTHSMSIKCLLREILQSDPGMTWKIDLDNTSITQLKYDEKGWHMLGVNIVPHL